MKSTLLLTVAAWLFCVAVSAQAPHTDVVRISNDSTRVTDTSKAGGAATASADDDGLGSPVVFAFLLGCAGIAVGAGIVGAMFAVMILGVLVLLALAGILSAGVLVGLYRRSMTAGFKTVLLLACSLGGLVTGAGGSYAANRYFHWHFATPTAVLAGAGSGFLGGLLLGLVVFLLIRAVLRFLKQKLAFEA